MESSSQQEQVRITDKSLGTGTEVFKGALVQIKYLGTLDDGTVFDSTEKHGKTFQCVVGSKKIIKGMSLGLMGMRVGGTRSIHIPASLAYGERQIGLIPPYSNLNFEVELIEALNRED